MTNYGEYQECSSYFAFYPEAWEGRDRHTVLAEFLAALFRARHTEAEYRQRRLFEAFRPPPLTKTERRRQARHQRKAARAAAQQLDPSVASVSS